MRHPQRLGNHFRLQGEWQCYLQCHLDCLLIYKIRQTSLSQSLLITATLKLGTQLNWLPAVCILVAFLYKGKVVEQLSALMPFCSCPAASVSFFVEEFLKFSLNCMSFWMYTVNVNFCVDCNMFATDAKLLQFTVVLQQTKLHVISNLFSFNCKPTCPHAPKLLWRCRSCARGTVSKAKRSLQTFCSKFGCVVGCFCWCDCSITVCGIPTVCPFLFTTNNASLTEVYFLVMIF